MISFLAYTLAMRLLAICPRIRKEGGCVVATTARRTRFLSLGTIYRQVIIDPANKMITIRSIYLWIIRLRRIVRFSDVHAITYGYTDMSPDSGLSFAHDSYDCFEVGLRFKDDSEIRLFSFIGEGTFSNKGPFPNWLYWSEYALDLAGSQEKESRAFVDLLSKMIGVTVVPSRGYW